METRAETKMKRKTVADYLDLPYRVEMVQEALSDGRLVYVVSHPDFPGCMSHGDTPNEAIENLREARELVLQHLIEHGLEVPVPDTASAAA
jgi:antitoxin HicB